MLRNFSRDSAEEQPTHALCSLLILSGALVALPCMSRQLQTDRRVKDHIDSKLKSSQQLEARLLAAPLLSDGESARVTNLELQVGLLLGAVGQAGKETLLQLIPTPTEVGCRTGAVTID